MQLYIFYNFILFKLRSTTEQMHALVFKENRHFFRRNLVKFEPECIPSSICGPPETKEKIGLKF
jgi:hypothetical protein